MASPRLSPLAVRAVQQIEQRRRELSRLGANPTSPAGGPRDTELVTHALQTLKCEVQNVCHGLVRSSERSHGVARTARGKAMAGPRMAQVAPKMSAATRQQITGSAPQPSETDAATAELRQQLEDLKACLAALLELEECILAIQAASQPLGAPWLTPTLMSIRMEIARLRMEIEAINMELTNSGGAPAATGSGTCGTSLSQAGSMTSGNQADRGKSGGFTASSRS